MQRTNRGLRLSRATHLRPPWTNEDSIRQNCTSCGDCLRVCPEAILISGPAATPVVNFANGECTFCGDCASACGEGVFRAQTEEPWTNIAKIDGSCLLTGGVECRSCTDFCDSRALRFDLTVRPKGQIALNADACTGCGACVAACPVGAITIQPSPTRSARDEHLRMSCSRRA